MDKRDIKSKKCCMECAHVSGCPMLIAFVQLCERPFAIHEFYCAEYQKTRSMKEPDIRGEVRRVPEKQFGKAAGAYCEARVSEGLRC